MSEPSMFEMIKQARSLQKQMSKIQKKVAKKKVQVDVGGGMVSVEISGKLVVSKIEIEQSLLDRNDKRLLQELVRTAVNSAIVKAQELMNEEMKDVAGGMNIPGLG